jgi:hypothetical protein
LITAYNRPILLDRLLTSVKSAYKSEEYVVVVVFHEEIEGVKEVLTKRVDLQLTLLPVCGKFRSALQNINLNRIFGLEYCFEMLESVSVLALEDDVEIGFDTLVFCEAIMSLYSEDKDFRCLNLGSREEFKESTRFDYGKFRYGLFGQGACIGRQQFLRERRFYDRSATLGFDCLLEKYYKTGFVVMPYCSRYINDGWSGTHAPKDPKDSYYQQLRSSFVGFAPFPLEPYKREKLPFSWRADCLPYEHGILRSWIREKLSV